MSFNIFDAFFEHVPNIFLFLWRVTILVYFRGKYFLNFWWCSSISKSKRSLPISSPNRIYFSSLAFERLPWHGPSAPGKEPVARPFIWDSKSKLSGVSNKHASTNPTPILCLCFHQAWIASAKLLEGASLEVNARNMNSFLEFHQFNQWWHVSVFAVVLINDFNCWQEISYASGVEDVKSWSAYFLNVSLSSPNLFACRFTESRKWNSHPFMYYRTSSP